MIWEDKGQDKGQDEWQDEGQDEWQDEWQEWRIKIKNRSRTADNEKIESRNVIYINKIIQNLWKNIKDGLLRENNIKKNMCIYIEWNKSFFSSVFILPCWFNF